MINRCKGCALDFEAMYKHQVYCTKDCRINSKPKRTYVRRSWNEKVNEKPFEELGWDHKRIRVILEQKQCCDKCKRDKWFDQVITLEVDHIDGNNKNNERSNLVALCCNCHALTSTFRGRNKRQSKFPPNNEFLVKYKELGNIRKTLLFFELAAKGGNYQKASYIISRANLLEDIVTERATISNGF